MKQRTFLIVALVLLLALAACRQEPAPEATEVVVAPTEAVTTETPEPTVAPTETAAPSETPTEEAAETPAPEPVDVTLERVENEALGISVLVPVGWTDAGAGVYVRSTDPTDVVRLIQQAAIGATVEDVTGALLPQLGITALPEQVDTLETGSLTWNLYEVEVEAPPVGLIAVDLALAETETATYIVLLQALPEEIEPLREAVFLPAVEGLQPLTEEAGAVYEDPAGQYTVPVPPNWNVEESDAYVTLVGPDEQLLVHILALESEDTRAAVDEAWSIVDPDFDREPGDTLDLPPSAAGGVDEFILVNYEGDTDQPIVQVEGRRYQGTVYVLIFIMDLEAVQQRQAQIQLIDTGFDITALEEADLSGVEPLVLDDALIAELEAYITANLEPLDVPGLEIAVVQGGEVVYSNGFGVRDRDTGEPVTPETLMMIGSTTKPLTTMMMASLVDEGAFEWDTPAVEILPTFAVADPDLSEQLTMRNLVCACTGVPRRDFEWILNASEMSGADIIASVADFEFFTDFGEAFQYSNQMVATGGYLATLAAGGELGALEQDYAELMQRDIFDPMEMQASTFSFDVVAAGDNAATPYGRTLTNDLVELPLDVEQVLEPVAPAGALWSNVLDMSNFILTNLNQGVAPNGERVVSAENLAVTWEPQVDINADASYGLGWIVEDYKGLPVLSHGGNTFGFTSELAFLPEAGLGISVIANQQGSALPGIVRTRLLELLYQQPSEVDELVQFALEQTAQGQQQLEESLLDQIDVDTITPYLGDYTNPVLGPVTVALEDGMFVFDAGEFSTEIRATESDGEVRYVLSAPPIAGMPLEFSEDDAGNPVMIFGLGVNEYTFEMAE